MLVLLIVALAVLGYIFYRVIKREGGIFLGPYEFRFNKESDPKQFLKRFRELEKKKLDFESRLVLNASANRFPQNEEFFKLRMEKIFSDLKEARSESQVEEIFERGEKILAEFGAKAEGEAIKLLDLFSKKLVQVQKEFNELKAERESERKRDIVQRNGEILAELESVLAGIKASDDEMGIRKAMNGAARIENELELSLLEPAQFDQYQELKTQFYRVAESKVEELRSLRYSKYNRKAIESLKRLLEKFSQNEKEYSKAASSFPLILKEHIATLNTAYFDGPTLQYFNYVYGYIFSLLEDDLKFEITRIMTETPKESLDL